MRVENFRGIREAYLFAVSPYPGGVPMFVLTARKCSNS
jgi:hypothetical protein